MDKKYLLRSGIRSAQMSRLLAKCIDMFIFLVMSTLFYPLGVLLGVAYIGISDAIPEGQSIGKKFMGFQVVSLKDGKACSFKQSIIRNLPLIIPLFFAINIVWMIPGVILLIVLALAEIYFIFNLDSGHRLGDVMADTSVIAGSFDATKLKKVQSEVGLFEDEDPQYTQKKLNSHQYYDMTY